MMLSEHITKHIPIIIIFMIWAFLLPSLIYSLFLTLRIKYYLYKIRCEIEKGKIMYSTLEALRRAAGN